MLSTFLERSRDPQRKRKRQRQRKVTTLSSPNVHGNMLLVLQARGTTRILVMDQETSGGRTPLVRGRRSVARCDTATLLALSFVRRRTRTMRGRRTRCPPLVRATLSPFQRGHGLVRNVTCTSRWGLRTAMVVVRHGDESGVQMMW